MNLNLILSVPAVITTSDVRIRMSGTKNDPLFCLADICRFIDVGNPADVKKRLDPDEFIEGVDIIDPLGIPQKACFVNEPGLYKILTTTRMKRDTDTPGVTERNARVKAFQRWICHDVIPSIRKFGCYPEPTDLAERDPIILALKQGLEIRQAQIRMEKAIAITNQIATDADTRSIVAQHEAQIARLEAQNAALVADAALAAHTNNHGYYTVLGYWRLHGREVTAAEASQHGKRLTAICRDTDTPVYQQRDTRYGLVNAYPESLLDQYLSDLDDGRYP